MTDLALLTNALVRLLARMPHVDVALSSDRIIVVDSRLDCTTVYRGKPLEALLADVVADLTEEYPNAL